MPAEPRHPIVVAISAGISEMPLGGIAQTIFDDIMERRKARAAEAMREVTETVGVQRFVDRMQSDEGLEALFAQALEALTRSGAAAKRIVLARAVARAFDNDEAIDEAALIVDVLGRLEPVHIRALAKLERAIGEVEIDEDHRADAERIMKATPTPVLSTLIQTGVCLPATLVGGGVAVYSVSPFGHQILQLLREVADEDLERLHG